VHHVRLVYALFFQDIPSFSPQKFHSCIFFKFAKMSRLFSYFLFPRAIAYCYDAACNTIIIVHFQATYNCCIIILLAESKIIHMIDNTQITNKMHVNVYDVLYTLYSHQHISAAIAAICKVILLQEHKGTNEVSCADVTP
jgi:hypothetical protein